MAPYNKRLKAQSLHSAGFLCDLLLMSERGYVEVKMGSLEIWSDIIILDINIISLYCDLCYNQSNHLWISVTKNDLKDDLSVFV